MEIQKVKEWKANKNKQFTIISEDDEGVIEVLRLKDEESFFIHSSVVTPKFNGYISEFHINCIHVLVYKHDSDETNMTEVDGLFNCAYFEINELLKVKRRPRRRIQAIKKKND